MSKKAEQKRRSMMREIRAKRLFSELRAALGRTVLTPAEVETVREQLHAEGYR